MSVLYLHTMTVSLSLDLTILQHSTNYKFLLRVTTPA